MALLGFYKVVFSFRWFPFCGPEMLVCIHKVDVLTRAYLADSKASSPKASEMKLESGSPSKLTASATPNAKSKVNI